MSHDMIKPTKWVCAQGRLRSSWASAQPDQSLRNALNGQLRTQGFFMQTVKTDQTGRMPRLAEWAAEDPRFLHADSENWSDWADAQADLVFAGRTAILLVLSCCSSNTTWSVSLNLTWFKAGRVSSVGCILLVCGRSCVWSSSLATFFWSWNISTAILSLPLIQERQLSFILLVKECAGKLPRKLAWEEWIG